MLLLLLLVLVPVPDLVLMMMMTKKSLLRTQHLQIDVLANSSTPPAATQKRR
jgi:hypothetical protein